HQKRSYPAELVRSFTSTKWWLDALLLASHLVGISMIYCGGMVLNDYLDRGVDAIERPSRPIPSKRVKPWQAAAMAFGLLVLGFIVSGGWAAPEIVNTQKSWNQFAPHLSVLLLLVAFVVVYNVVHQATVIGVVIMGLCRALAFLVPAFLFVNEPFSAPLNAFWIFAPAVTLFLYTLAISIVARREVEHDASAAQPRRFGLLPRKFGGPKTVMNMIAAIPLLDAVWLIVMGLWPASLFCVACAGMTKLAHRKVAGS
ncbi:MAG: UbiA family prenyltransferase, partial [Phycisphaeraceae bacterium]